MTKVPSCSIGGPKQRPAENESVALLINSSSVMSVL
jgi:hypothetical protein